MKQKLDSPLSVEELLKAIDTMTNGKTAGPDSLPIDLYKAFKNQLIRPLFEMFEESLETGILPPSLRKALITLLPKPDKPQHYCESYRPISLINTDAKILAKALAMRLEGYLPAIIHNDQNGFVKGRQAFHNIRRALNIIHEKTDTTDNCCLWMPKRRLTELNGLIYLICSPDMDVDLNSVNGLNYCIVNHWQKLLLTT